MGYKEDAAQRFVVDAGNDVCDVEIVAVIGSNLPTLYEHGVHSKAFKFVDEILGAGFMLRCVRHAWAECYLAGNKIVCAVGVEVS